VNLAVRNGDSMVDPAHVKSNYYMLRLLTRPGARVPLYATGVGKLFFSLLEETELDAYPEQTRPTPYTPHILVEKDKIVKACAAAISSQLGFNPANST
jgi:DNA-binding IclR family transcriptional regulator